MSVFVRLVQIYEAYGLAVQTGLNPWHFPGQAWAELPFTQIRKNRQPACKGGGIAPLEVCFLEVLFADYHPKNLFVVGNAYGWSSVALALANPSARVIAIDACPRPEEAEGIDFTNLVAKDYGLNLVAEKALSPDDVARVASDHLDGPVDFAFIDGGHTNVQQARDFGAVHAIASPDCAYLFHDVINFGLIEGFAEIIRSVPRLEGKVLYRTPSGMAIAYPTGIAPEVQLTVEAFTEDLGDVERLLEEGRRLLLEEVAQENGSR